MFLATLAGGGGLQKWDRFCLAYGFSCVARQSLEIKSLERKRDDSSSVIKDFLVRNCVNPASGHDQPHARSSENSLPTKNCKYFKLYPTFVRFGKVLDRVSDEKSLPKLTRPMSFRLEHYFDAIMNVPVTIYCIL